MIILSDCMYTQSQKKRTMSSLVSPVTQGQGQVTPAGLHDIKITDKMKYTAKLIYLHYVAKETQLSTVRFFWDWVYTEKKVEPKRLHLLKVEPFFLKRYLNGGHPVDMKTAPPRTRFGSTFFLQCTRSLTSRSNAFLFFLKTLNPFLMPIVESSLSIMSAPWDSKGSTNHLGVARIFGMDFFFWLPLTKKSGNPQRF